MQLEEFSMDSVGEGLNTILKEHPEVKTLYERRSHYPSPVVIKGVNPLFHVLIEGIVEDQLQDENLKGVREAFHRLQQENGLTAHAARASIAQVLTLDIYAVLKDRTSFDSEAYVRRLTLLGTDVRKLGRNDRCPCGSGAKFKRCCTPYADYFSLNPLAGMINLGFGWYLSELELEDDITDPLDPIFQLEARSHISRYMESLGDIEGSEIVLRENIQCAETYNDGVFLSNALQDYVLLCENNRELSEKGLAPMDRLIELSNEDYKDYLYCDKADLLAKTGNHAAADQEYHKIFAQYPNFHFARYRYADMLKEHERIDEAANALQDLLAIDTIDPTLRKTAVEMQADLEESQKA